VGMCSGSVGGLLRIVKEFIFQRLIEEREKLEPANRPAAGYKIQSVGLSDLLLHKKKIDISGIEVVL
jgi:hypothetical protein